MRELTISGRRIADDTDAWVIAEIGNNHGGSVETCRQMILAAARAGADAVKLQKRELGYWAQHDPRWNQPYNSEHSFGATYGEHRAALEFGWDEYRELQSFADDLGLVFFATAFDLFSLDFLLRLGVPVIKLASASIVNYPLLVGCYVAGLPVILSTGGATESEVANALGHLWGPTMVTDDPPVALLQCTAEYPCDPAHMNLRYIESLRNRYGRTVIGLSDHQSGIAMAPVAYALGARIFEKHFTLNRAMKGSDNVFSLEPEGMRKMVRDLKRARLAMGDGLKRRYDDEVPALVKMGRSDLAVERMTA